MDTLVYAPEAANQQEPWQIGSSSHYPTELIASLAQIENSEAAAALPPQSLLLMNDISNLMASITMAMSQGPNTPAYLLAQTFQPLIQMAVGLQITALQGGGGGLGAHADQQMMVPALGNEYYQQERVAPEEPPVERNDVKEPAEERVTKAPAAGKKRKEADDGGGFGREQQNASRAPRQRQISSRFSDFVNFDDV